MKRKSLTAGLTLLSLVSALCLAGLKRVDKRLAEREKKS